VIAALILIGGWFARPRERPESPAPPPSQTELEQLARRAERRSLESTEEFFAGLARDAAAGLAYLRETGGTAVIWSPTLAVSAPLPASLRSATMMMAGTSSSATPALRGADVPLATLTIAAERGVRPAHRAETAPLPGSAIVAVWRTADRPAFVHGNVAAVTPSRCGRLAITEIQAGFGLTPAMLGGGLFNLDGDLIAMVLPCGDRLAAVAVDALQAELDRKVTAAEQLLARYGAALVPIADEDRDLFKTTGVLVGEITNGSVAAAAGLMVGDVIITAGDREIRSIDDLEPVSAFDPPAALRVQRGARQVVLTLQPAAAEKVPPSGVAWSLPPSDAVTIRAVAPDSRAARAGLQPGDRVVAINRIAVGGTAALDRALSAGNRAPVLLEIERGSRRMLIVVR
jgi:S1-C subfamily serine protease